MVLTVTNSRCKDLGIELGKGIVPMACSFCFWRGRLSCKLSGSLLIRKLRIRLGWRGQLGLTVLGSSHPQTLSVLCTGSKSVCGAWTDPASGAWSVV